MNEPLQTGIKAIDSMIPIGRGQRELIIGDRKTGKTAIAIDAIINQKGGDVICVYVAVGQKESTVAERGREAQEARRHGLHHRRLRLGSSDPAPLQYIAPYAGAAMAEYFMYQKGQADPGASTTTFPSRPRPTASSPCCCAGRRAARPTPATSSTSTPASWSAAVKLRDRVRGGAQGHRRRTPPTARLAKDHPEGLSAPEEHRPDDSFKGLYHRAEGTERAEAWLETLDDKDQFRVHSYPDSGGSMTALPIIETLEGEVSAYIPTNVISITDGQIYLEPDLFFAGVRPGGERRHQRLGWAATPSERR